jgi:hypothetical protein
LVTCSKVTGSDHFLHRLSCLVGFSCLLLLFQQTARRVTASSSGVMSTFHSPLCWSTRHHLNAHYNPLMGCTGLLTLTHSLGPYAGCAVKSLHSHKSVCRMLNQKCFVRLEVIAAASMKILEYDIISCFVVYFTTLSLSELYSVER